MTGFVRSPSANECKPSQRARQLGHMTRLTTFTSRSEFRKWLQANHKSSTELLVRCYKVRARDKGLTYREALDEALCFGWIDGVRRAVNKESFSTRFSPRKAKSKWSAVNIRRAQQLETEGRMDDSGLAAFRARGNGNARRYSFEEKPSKLDSKSQTAFRGNRRAWTFFQAQARWYQRTSVFWVMDAKREETRARRLAELIARSARGEAIKPLAGARLRER
jgi:uncharacterized protein YdeI (YjbR/CyaY-like superfamily)